MYAGMYDEVLWLIGVVSDRCGEKHKGKQFVFKHFAFKALCILLCHESCQHQLLAMICYRAICYLMCRICCSLYVIMLYESCLYLICRICYLLSYQAPCSYHPHTPSCVYVCVCRAFQTRDRYRVCWRDG